MQIGRRDGEMEGNHRSSAMADVYEGEELGHGDRRRDWVGSVEHGHGDRSGRSSTSALGTVTGGPGSWDSGEDKQRVWWNSTMGD